MSFFQNPFYEEFRGNLLLGDRAHIPAFIVKGNTGRDFNRIANWTEPTLSGTAYIHDLDGSDANGGDLSLLTIRLAVTPERGQGGKEHFNTVSVDIAGTTPALTSPAEITTLLNDDTMFATFFEASLRSYNRGYNAFPATPPQQVVITSKRSQQIKYFIENEGAEQVLGFNDRAGVAETPSYFKRHTTQEAYLHNDSTASLVSLSAVITFISSSSNAITSRRHGLANGDLIRIEGSNSTPTVNGDRTVTVVDDDSFTVAVTVTGDGDRGEWAKKIAETVISSSVDEKLAVQNFTLASAQADWELFAGKSQIFNFKNITVDGSDRITQIIEYPAGAVAGDLARKTLHTYTGSNINPDTSAEMPYTLLSSDLITP